MRNSFRRAAHRGAALLPLLVLLAAGVLLYAFREPLLRAPALFLDAGGPPQRADAILVLAGGWRGERMLKAGELIRQGYAPRAYVSGPRSFYERPECDAAIPFAVERGFPAQWFECLPNSASSTREEARMLLPELERRGVRRLLLVSVRTHLRRAKWFFEAARPRGMEIHYVGADDPAYRLEQWWQSREGKKAVVMEWVKILALPVDS
ncbi:MAG: YdcF family protein [Bryobacteraceae bacterium]|nr:YdcF family protein [Bryobacteraceae bacterium]